MARHRRHTHVSRRKVLRVGATGATALAVTPVIKAGARGPTSTTNADIVGQGVDGDTVAEDGARLTRNDTGINTSISMQTPAPGTYEYPSDDMDEGPPEAFTLWVFVFDDPDDEDWTGAFLGGGHIVAGDTLQLSGRVSVQTEPFAGEPLKNPREAEVHFAVAAHGEVDSDELPDQIKTSPGGPDTWWYAFFDGDE